MATNQISPTEITRGTLSKKTGEPLKDMGVSDNIQPEAGVGTPSNEDRMRQQFPELMGDSMQQTQQPTQIPQDNQIGTAFKAASSAIGEPFKAQGTAIGQPMKATGTEIGEAVKIEREAPTGPSSEELAGMEVKESQNIADKAYRQINKAIQAGKEVDEETRRTVVEKIAQMEGAPERIQEALRLVGRRFDETGVDEVEMAAEEVTKNQQIVDTMLAMEPDTMLEAMNMSDLPVAVRSQIVNSPQYKQALQDKKDKEQIQFFNDMVSGNPGPRAKPETTTDGVKDSLGIDKPDAQTKQDIKDIVSDDRLTTLSSEIGDLDTKISDLQQEMNNLKTDIENEFPSSISKSALNAIIYDRQIGINNQLQSKLATREAKAADYQRVQQERELELQRKLQQQQQTMDFLGSSNGAALFGTSFNDLQAMEQQGRLPEGYSSMYKNYQEGLIYNTLQQMGNPTSDDMAFISGALEQGATPQEILAGMGQMPQFQQPAYGMDLLSKTVKSGDKTYQFNPETGRYDIGVGFNPIAEQTEPGYVEITDDTFGLFRQTPNDYKGNTGADYPAQKGSPFRVPAGGTITGVERHSTGNIRVRMEMEDGRSLTVDHLDPKTLAHLGVDQDFTGKKSLNIPVGAGEPIGFVGNTGNVKTIDPATGNWVDVRKGGKLLRPDLAHKGVHASVSIYDQNGNMYSVADTDRELKNLASSHKDLSKYAAVVENWVEGGKMPGASTLKAMGLSESQFVDQANKTYANLVSEEYATKGFELNNPAILAKTDTQLKRDLNKSIDAAAQAQPSFDRLISLIDQYGAETLPGKVKDEMTQLYEDILLKGKEIYNLGVLNGPDLVIMENVLGGRPTDLTARFKTKRRLIKQFENARRAFNESVDSKAQNYGLTFNPDVVTQQQQMADIQQQQQTLNDYAMFEQEFNQNLGL